MKKLNLETKIARLESINDQLETELGYVNGLLRSVGFPNGIQSVKEVALELIQNEGIVSVVKPKKPRKEQK